MKKFLLFAVCSLAAIPLMAASTCVSRVDKNLDKTTAEKIDFCLTEEPVLTDETPATEVVLSETQTVQYPKPKTKRKKNTPAKQQTTKVYTTAPVSLEYYDRETYPAFRNDTLPRVSVETAHETALQAIEAGKKQNKKAAKKTNKKPKRKLKKQEAAPVVPPSAEPLPAPKPEFAVRCATITCSATSETPVVTPLSTPSAAANAEVAQAQALQADPWAQDNTNGNTAPDGFLDGGVMSDNNFGYNATDPALQP